LLTLTLLDALVFRVREPPFNWTKLKILTKLKTLTKLKILTKLKTLTKLKIYP
jgi:hypothetical protein